MRDAGVPTQLRQVQFVASSGSDEFEERRKRLEVTDPQDLTDVALDIGRGVVREPACRVELTVVDPRVCGSYVNPRLFRYDLRQRRLCIPGHRRRRESPLR